MKVERFNKKNVTLFIIENNFQNKIFTILAIP